MSKPNHHMIFPLDNVEDVAQVMDLPYGDLLTIGINRWNGNVVMSYQDHPEARFYIRLIVAQLAGYVDMFDEDNYSEPRHGLIGSDGAVCVFPDCRELCPCEFQEVS